eukprot:TRINITY_DN6469_c1_g1_i5.p5 TRINITY_DN6469_c1_g1~~TRINITY_DN6469_c1_g1_i5.p5  ORF type:complete len:127 (-),score=7.19 TRINITY_DN6469_c1_g1_i5:638-1018(-)
MDSVTKVFEDLKAQLLPEENKSKNKQRNKRQQQQSRAVATEVTKQTFISNGEQKAIGKRTGNLKSLHQLWYMEDDFTFVPMACYRTRQAPETAHILSDSDADGNCVWCVPMSKKYAIHEIPPFQRG